METSYRCKMAKRDAFLIMFCQLLPGIKDFLKTKDENIAKLEDDE